MNSCFLCSTRIPSPESYCSSCENQRTEQNNLKSLVQQKTSLNNPQEVVKFETWWNRNLATVVNGNYSYSVWLLVYVEPEIKKFETSSSDYDLNNAKNKATRLRVDLNGNNPILYIHSGANSYASFNELTREPYVIRIDLPYETEIRGRSCACCPDCPCYHCSCNDTTEIYIPFSSPKNYLKSLDIVKVKREAVGNKFYHFGIYLGSGQVCHYSNPNSKIKTDNNQARITSWETFVRGYVDGEVVGYHPIIPFKFYQEIAKNIAWDEANNYGNLRYCLANNNCEHYVNSRVFGLNWSEQVAEKPSKALEILMVSLAGIKIVVNASQE